MWPSESYDLYTALERRSARGTGLVFSLSISTEVSVGCIHRALESGIVLHLQCTGEKRDEKALEGIWSSGEMGVGLMLPIV